MNKKYIISAILSVFFLVPTYAHADTFSVGETTATVNLNTTTFNPSQSIHVTGSLYTNGGSADEVSLAANGTTFISSTGSMYNTVYGEIYITAPATPGGYSVSITAGRHTPDMPTITSVGASSRPYMGGTTDDHVECSANLNASAPSPNGIGTISIQYRYRNAYSPSEVWWGNCGVTINPGDASGVDNGTYMGEWLSDYYNDYSCTDYNGSGAPVAPSAAC